MYGILISCLVAAHLTTEGHFTMTAQYQTKKNVSIAKLAGLYSLRSEI